MGFEPQEQSDSVLVEAAQVGRLDSFSALYRRYHNPIVALAYAQLGDRHLAEDAAQEVFAIACRDIRSLRDFEKFGAWLAGICRNVTKQMLRVRKQCISVTDEPLEERQLERDEQNEAVRRVVWQLPPAERELIVMRYFDGFSQAKIAQVLDLSPSAVNGRLLRAKRKIAEQLKRAGFGT